MHPHESGLSNLETSILGKRLHRPLDSSANFIPYARKAEGTHGLSEEVFPSELSL